MSRPLFETFTDLDTFVMDGMPYAVRCTGSMAVAEGVVCDTYAFEDDSSCDLGIIKIDEGHSTPLQLVAKGDRTIEKHLGGLGTLSITAPDGTTRYPVPNKDSYPYLFHTTVQVGEAMRWRANRGAPLVVAEICYPPYEDGRFVNI